MTNPDLALFQANPEPMWIRDHAGTRTLAVNAAALARYGRSEDEFLALAPDALSVPVDAAGYPDWARTSAASNDLHRLPGDVWLPVWVTETPVRFRGHEAVLVQARDVSPWVALERDNRARRRDGSATGAAGDSSSAQLRLLEDAMNRVEDVVMITEARPLDDPGPRMVFVNDAFERQTGYRRADVLGRSPRLLQGPETDRRELDRIREALAAERPVRAEVVNYTREGSPFRVDMAIAPIFDARGVVSHYVSVQRDVTERAAAERALADAQAQLRLSEERSRLVAETTADLVWDWDVSSGSVWRSSGSPGLFEGAGAAPSGYQDWRERLHPEDVDRTVAGLQAVVADPAARDWEALYRFRRNDGSWAQIRDRGSVIRDGAGRAVRVVGSMLDITEQRELEDQLQRAQRLDAVGQLTGGVAHDFNNLLTVILGNADLLADALAGERRLLSLVTMTRSAAERGAELTRRLLAFARRQALDPAATDIDALLGGMIELLHRTLGEHVEIDFRPGDGTWQAMVDAPQLESALLNLCLNARDAMPAGGRLVIRTGNLTLDGSEHLHKGAVAPGDYVTISVADSGVGMPAEIVQHAFEPFFTTKETGKGSGLGLSMVYGFIKQSAGHVQLESTPGVGTTVTLYLPRAPAASDATAASRPGAAVVGGNERLLVVEDDAIVRAFVADQLHGLGYEVVTAATGPEALGMLERGADFDLLFTDMVMPGGMNGRELADAARALRPDLPVLFTSGYTEDGVVRGGRRDGGVALLPKPYRRADLAASIRDVLAAARRR
jgi:PAS domain S-box-containing protein